MSKLYSLVLVPLSKALRSRPVAGAASAFLLVATLALPLGSSAYADSHAETYRFAVVNMAAVLRRAPQSAAESEKLEERFASRETALAAKQERLLKADEAFNRERNLLSAAQLVQRESELRALQRSLKREREDLREEVRISKDRALNRLQSKVADAIETIRQREAIDIIFRESDYIVASERVNVTSQVLAELQQQFEFESNQSDTAASSQENDDQDEASENTAIGD